MIIGAVQCVLAVVFGVGLLAGVISDAGGESFVYLLTALVFELLFAALFVAGLVGLVSALEEWDPPAGRWNGIRWRTLGWSASAVSLVSWVVAAFVLWLTRL